MTKWRLFVLTPAVFAAAFVIAGACRDATGPTLQRTPVDLASGGKPGGGGGGEQINVRFTGGGRVDGHSHADGSAKNTPESHDFATFGFQARPTGSGTEGSGNITWVEHNPAAIGGGFTFHGTVTSMMSPAASEDLGGTSPSDCADFGGTGRIHTRNGDEAPASFEVTHACDVQEPGVGYDHIRIVIMYGTGYSRHSILSGGNIQKHKN